MVELVVYMVNNDRTMYCGRAFLRLVSWQTSVVDQPCGRTFPVRVRNKSTPAASCRGGPTLDDVSWSQSRVQGSRWCATTHPRLRHTFTAAAAAPESMRPSRSLSQQTARALWRVWQWQDIGHGQGQCAINKPIWYIRQDRPQIGIYRLQYKPVETAYFMLTNRRW